MMALPSGSLQAMRVSSGGCQDAPVESPSGTALGDPVDRKEMRLAQHYLGAVLVMASCID